MNSTFQQSQNQINSTTESENIIESTENIENNNNNNDNQNQEIIQINENYEQQQTIPDHSDNFEPAPPDTPVKKTNQIYFETPKVNTYGKQPKNYGKIQKASSLDKRVNKSQSISEANSSPT